MPDALTTNRKMYWRIVRRMLLGNRARLLVILLALCAGATVTAALLNLQVDAKRRLTKEFSVFGPNVLITPFATEANDGGATLDSSMARSVPLHRGSGNVRVSSVLYAVGNVSPVDSGKSVSAVVAGRNPFAFLQARVQSQPSIVPENPCVLGTKLAENLGAVQEDELAYRVRGVQAKCKVAGITSTGGPEDNQLLLPLQAVQAAANLPDRASAIELAVSGTPAEIQNYIANLERSVTGVDVHPIRQFTEAQAKIYGRISGLLNLTVGMVLVLTGLCVMAAMANVAMERRNDVGLMKAIGGATRRVLRLFLAEAAALGLIGGALGGALGILVSMYLGKAVFGLAAVPRWVVYPVSVMLTLLVAIVGSLPLRRLAAIRPASVFRGEA